MKEAYVKTKNGFYLFSASETLVIERSDKNYNMPFKSITNAKKYIKRISKLESMKRFLPLTIEVV